MFLSSASTTAPAAQIGNLPATDLRARPIEDSLVVPEPDLAAIANPKTREEAARDVQRVRDTFTTENLLAGAEIVRGITRAFRLEQRQKTVYFARDGYIAWIYAYVKESALQPPQ